MPILNPAEIAAAGGVAVLGASGAPVRVYGIAGSSAVTAASITIPANTILPGSVIEFNGLFNFLSPNNAGRVIQVYFGSTVIWQSFPTASLGALNTKVFGVVSPDRQTIYVYSQSLNDVSSPTNGQGQPFSAHTSVPVSVNVDFTSEQIFKVNISPTNNDVAELTGWSLVMQAPGLLGANYAPSNAVACWGDSLTAGSGSTGSFGADRTGTSTNGSAVVTMSNTTGIVAGQNITGPGVPANTTILSVVANTSVTMSANAGVGAGAGTFSIAAGAWPAQLMYSAPGRPVTNLGVGGETAAQIAARVVRDKVRGRLQTCVFAMGRNSDWSTPSGRADIMAQIATAVGNLASGVKFVVCSVTTAQGETTGTGNNTAILALNALISAAYPSNYADTFSAVCTNSGSPPAAYLASGTAGEVHLNDLGYLQMMTVIKAKLTALGA